MAAPESSSELRNLRRGRERVDGLEHLRKDEPLVMAEEEGSATSHDLSNLRMIAYDLVQLIYYVLFFARFARETLKYETDSYERNLQNFIEAEQLNPVLYKDHLPATEWLRAFAQTMSDDKVRNVMQKTVFDPYLSRLFHNGVSSYSIHNVRKKFVDAPNPELLEVLVTATDQNLFDIITQVTQNWIKALTTLRRSFEVALDLRTHVRRAIDHNELDGVSMSALRLKMTALNDHFYEASLLLGHDPPLHNLVWEGEQWWLPPEEQTIPPAFNDSTPKNVVQAYQISSNTNATLTVLVPLTVLLSTIPMALSWYHSSGGPGTISDPDFWQLVASSVIQMLGVATLTVPTIFNLRLAKVAWFWTWIFAGLSVCCSIVAPPLYLNLPTKWSAMISFGGSLAQTFITLQLMFTI